MEKERNLHATATCATIDANGARLPEPDRLAIIDRDFDALLEALQASRSELRLPLIEAADTIGASLAQGGKLLICGNGGSAAEAQHFAAELVGRFKVPGRRALPALALTADAAVLTAWSNDAGYEDVFARQVEAFGRSGDVLVGLSTSGHSRNVIQAFRTANHLGLSCLAILGGDGGDLRHLANVSIVVPTSDTQRIQEVHTLIVHLICELVEKQLVLDSTVAHSPSAAEPDAIWAPALQRV